MLIQLLILAFWSACKLAFAPFAIAAWLVLLLHAGIRPRDLLRGLVG